MKRPNNLNILFSFQHPTDSWCTDETINAMITSFVSDVSDIKYV